VLRHLHALGRDDGLRREGRVLDLVHALNAMRKSAGLELTDRIVVTLPRREEELLAYRDRIANEVLAREIKLGDDLEITKA
jgi:isoleucyl-tRNA synthetase